MNTSHELQVAARVKESTQEITALNSMLNNMKEAEVKQAAKHKQQMEKTRKLAQERVATAQTAVAAAQKATDDLQEKAAMQLKDVNNKVHQAQAKLLTVWCLTHQCGCRHACGTQPGVAGRCHLEFHLACLSLVNVLNEAGRV